MHEVESHAIPDKWLLSGQTETDWSVLQVIIHMDQTCFSHDYVISMRDILDVCRHFNVDVGIVSLDQEKGFDRVEPYYALKAFGCGDAFLFWISLLYSGAQCMLKVDTVVIQGTTGSSYFRICFWNISLLFEHSSCHILQPFHL